RGRSTNLAEALRYAAKLLRHHAIVVVLSDFRAEGWEDALAQLAAANDVVAITIDDPRELILPDTGWVDMEDAETGQRVLSDTSGLEREIPVPPGWQVRAGKLEAREDVEPLGDPAVVRSRAGWVIRYGVAVWTPGSHTLTLPPLWRVGPDGRTDSSAGGTASFAVASVLPDSVKAPDPRGVPEAHLALATPECLTVVERARPTAPIGELRDVLERLDRVAFATAAGSDVAALAAQARRLARELAP